MGARINSGSDSATMNRNLVRFSPVISEFTRLKCVTDNTITLALHNEYRYAYVRISSPMVQLGYIMQNFVNFGPVTLKITSLECVQQAFQQVSLTAFVTQRHC